MVVVDRALGREPTTIVEIEDSQKFKVFNQMSIGELAAHLLNGKIEAKTEKILQTIFTIREGAELSRTFKILINGVEVGPYTPISKFDPPLKISLERR